MAMPVWPGSLASSTLTPGSETSAVQPAGLSNSSRIVWLRATWGCAASATARAIASHRNGPRPIRPPRTVPLFHSAAVKKTDPATAARAASAFGSRRRGRDRPTDRLRELGVAERVQMTARVAVDAARLVLEQHGQIGER